MKRKHYKLLINRSDVRNAVCRNIHILVSRSVADVFNAANLQYCDLMKSSIDEHSGCKLSYVRTAVPLIAVNFLARTM